MWSGVEWFSVVWFSVVWCALFTFHQRLEIPKCDQLTYRRTWVGARDTCVSKNDRMIPESTTQHLLPQMPLSAIGQDKIDAVD